MQCVEKTMADPLIMTGLFHVISHDKFRLNTCRTRHLVDDFYLCQLNRADCDNAVSFGMSYLCSSFERHEYSN